MAGSTASYQCSSMPPVACAVSQGSWPIYFNARPEQWLPGPFTDIAAVNREPPNCQNFQVLRSGDSSRQVVSDLG